MNKFNPPAELILDGNLSECWTTWRREFQFYLTASEFKNRPDEVKTSRLLSAIGPKSREIYYTFNFANDEESMTFDVVIQKFEDYFTPKKNITYQRYRFFSYNQNDGQSIDSYATELRTRADHCHFGDLKDSLIRDKIVIGIRDSKTQERLLRESDLSLDKALQICRASEEVKLQTQEIQGASGGMINTKVNFVNSKHSTGLKSQVHISLSQQCLDGK